MLFLGFLQMTSSSLQSIQLKELGNEILRTLLVKALQDLALCSGKWLKIEIKFDFCVGKRHKMEIPFPPF